MDELRKNINSIISISDKDWAILKPMFAYKAIKKNEFFLLEGKHSNTVFYVIKGAFRVFTVVDGEERDWHFHFEGNWGSDYESFLTNRPSRFSIQAMEDAEILTLSRDSMHALYNTDAKFERIGRIIAEQLFLFARNRGMDFLLQNPEDRYLKLIKEYPNIFNRVPLYHIASYLGIKGPSLSRIRRRLSEK
ncbi:MAG: Crp/Fnr family transcriptional regulator [Cyclobacteriaceae bacterium]|jgi:CRP-like cAMP-binding protein